MKNLETPGKTGRVGRYAVLLCKILESRLVFKKAMFIATMF